MYLLKKWWAKLFNWLNPVKSTDEIFDIPQNNITKTKAKSSKLDVNTLPTQYKTIRHLMKDLDRIYGNLVKAKNRCNFLDKILNDYGVYAVYDDIDEEGQHLYRTNRIPKYLLKLKVPSMFSVYHDSRKVDGIDYTITCVKEKSFIKDTILYDVHFGLFTEQYKNIYYLPVKILIHKKTGTIKILKFPQPNHGLIHSKTRGWVAVHQTIRDYPIQIKSAVGGTIADNKAKEGDKYKGPETIDEWITSVFVVNYQFNSERDMSTCVLAKRDKLRVSFTIPYHTTPYFFKDRIGARTPTGQKCKIFHTVKSHFREYKTGKTTSVKMHFRGERKFTWNNTKMVIILPGLHGATHNSFDLEAIPEEDVHKYKDEPLLNIDDKGMVEKYNSVMGWD